MKSATVLFLIAASIIVAVVWATWPAKPAAAAWRSLIGAGRSGDIGLVGQAVGQRDGICDGFPV